VKERTILLRVPDGTDMAVFTAGPDEPAKAGILVFQEIFGVNHHIQSICRRLAEEGYLAIAPELFHRTAPAGWEGPYSDFPAAKPHMEALTPENIMMDLRTAYEWLRGGEGIGEGPIGAVGFCLGGMVAFGANTVLDLKCAVSFYGSRILSQFMPIVKDQKAPLLLLWGGQDKSTPPDKVKELTDALRAAGKDFISAEFSQAGHGFNCDERSAFHPASAASAWAMTLGFFHHHLL
jgi:carboxymethylenebutenolidase